MLLSMTSSFFVLNPAKFALPYSLGSILSLLSTGFLMVRMFIVILREYLHYMPTPLLLSSFLGPIEANQDDVQPRKADRFYHLLTSSSCHVVRVLDPARGYLLDLAMCVCAVLCVLVVRLVVYPLWEKYGKYLL